MLRAHLDSASNSTGWNCHHTFNLNLYWCDEAVSATQPLETLYHLDDPPTVDEIEFALKSLKANKAAGADGIVPELFKYGGDALVQELHRISLSCWHAGSVPKE